MNIRHILAATLAIAAILLTLVLDGRLQVLSTPLPSIGNLLHPMDGLWANGTSATPPAHQSINIPGLSSPAEIYYDDRGVPHIYAQNMEDALAAQGYAEARDRTFQLDFALRAASGRLSEVAGATTLEIDRSTRRKGLPYSAAKALTQARSQPSFPYATAYVRGINAYLGTLDRRSRPFEAKFLNYDIPLWTEENILLIRMYMNQYLNSVSHDIANTNLLALLGPDQFNKLYPRRNPRTQHIVPESSFESDEILDVSPIKNDIASDTFVHAYYHNQPDGIGSNNWALNARKTANGKPIYASDPHLNLNLPSIWYEMQIHTPDMHVHGVKIVGIPGLMMGFNEHIAWGETNVGHDQTDFYRIHWHDRSKREYLLDGQVRQAKARIERIAVKGQATHIDTIWWTDWGPITHWSNDGEHDLAMRWIIHDGIDTDELATFTEVMRAKSYSDYAKAIRPYLGPPQNFAMATYDDTVAIRVNGRLPLRSEGDGVFIEEGDQSANGWQQHIPRDQNPLILNPERGYVTSSNQESTAPDYPYYYYGNFGDFRNRIIDRWLSGHDGISLQDVKKFQMDDFSQIAADILPHMLRVMQNVEVSTEERKMLDQLAEWDFRFKADSPLPTLFNTWFTKTKLKANKKTYQQKKRMELRYVEPWRLIDMLTNMPNDAYFDDQNTAQVESGDDLIKAAWKDTWQGDIATWGEDKPMHIDHIMHLPGLGQEGVITDGCRRCVNAVGTTWGPSWRMVVELGKQDVEAYGIFPGGQSGNPCSPLYRTGIDKWAAGEYYDLKLYPQQDQLPNRTHRITLNK